MAIIFKYLDKPLSLIFYKRYEIFFVLVFIAAVIIRLQNTFHESMWSDEALYAWCGFRIFSHPGLLFSKEIISFHPPLFSIFIALAHNFLPSETAARIISPIFGSVSILLVYLLGKELRNKFVGVICSAVLAFHNLHILGSTRILLDATQTAFYMLLVLLLVRYGAFEDIKISIIIGFLASAIVLLKWSGVLVIPLLLSYYFLLMIFSRAPFKTIKKPLLISLSIVSFCIILLLINNYLKLGRLLSDTSFFIEPLNSGPPWEYFIHLADILGFRFLLPFFLYGLIVVFRESPRVKSILLSWFFVILILLSLVPLKVPRYTLPIMPAMLLITGFGMDNILRLTIKSAKTIDIFKVAVIIFILIYLIFTYPSSKARLDFEAKSSGYREAGAWIRENASNGALILADSARQIRYHSGINFKEFNGDIVELVKFKNDIKNIISSSKETIFLELDIWESGLYKSPLMDILFKERIRSFEKLGFKSVKEIKSNILGKVIPVFVILKKATSQKK